MVPGWLEDWAHRGQKPVLSPPSTYREHSKRGRDGNYGGIRRRFRRILPHGNPDPPSWSPDGSEILFGGYTLTYANLETKEVRYHDVSTSSNATPVLFSTPVRSPDGTRIAAVIEHDLSRRPEVLLSHLITMRPDGTDKRLIMGWQPETYEAVAGLGKAWIPPIGVSWQWTEVSAHPCPKAGGCG